MRSRPGLYPSELTCFDQTDPSKLGDYALDKQAADRHDSPVESAPAEETGAPEIEMTPEMIEAGVETFERNRSLEFMESEDAVICIFRAMVLASPKFAVPGSDCEAK